MGRPKSNEWANYSQKLLDPRWQKRRLEILERDRWQCAGCGELNTTLHVHHMFYSWKWVNDGQNRVRCDPWESPDRALITLCADCHETPTCIDHQNLLLEELYNHFPPGEDAFDFANFLKQAHDPKRIDMRGFTPWMIRFFKRLLDTLRINEDGMTGY